MPPSFEAGQYAFLNIPEISTLQWHPFTISSAPSEHLLRFYIKSMGPGSWTENLFQLAQTSSTLNSVPMINIDAPYGLGLEWKRYSLTQCLKLLRYRRLIIIVGGVGVTPALSILEELYQQCSKQPDTWNTKVDCLWALGGIGFLQQSNIGKQLERIHG